MLAAHSTGVYTHCFLSEPCYCFYCLREKDKGISARHYFHMTSTCRVGVALLKLHCLFIGGGAGEVTLLFLRLTNIISLRLLTPPVPSKYFAFSMENENNLRRKKVQYYQEGCGTEWGGGTLCICGKWEGLLGRVITVEHMGRPWI